VAEHQPVLSRNPHGVLLKAIYTLTTSAHCCSYPCGMVSIYLHRILWVSTEKALQSNSNKCMPPLNSFAMRSITSPIDSQIPQTCTVSQISTPQHNPLISTPQARTCGTEAGNQCSGTSSADWCSSSGLSQ
jgi:hypothetical protein